MIGLALELLNGNDLYLNDEVLYQCTYVCVCVCIISVHVYRSVSHLSVQYTPLLGSFP